MKLVEEFTHEKSVTMSAYTFAINRNLTSEFRNEISWRSSGNFTNMKNLKQCLYKKEFHDEIVEDLMEFFGYLQENKPWIVRILVNASLSLAAKMMNINNLSISHIIIPVSNNNSSMNQAEQRDDEGLIFDLQSIHRMENLILTTLNWRLRSVTPFAFLQYYNSLFEFSNDESLSQSLEDRASDIIFCSHYGNVLWNLCLIYDLSISSN